jgi:hypothetical protein
MKEKFRYRKEIARSGWQLSATVDNGTATFSCENCGFPHVRFMHELINQRKGQQVKVGCVCAEHLIQDFTTPKLRERALKGRAGRRMRWPTLNWRLSRNGNLYLRKAGVVVVLRRGPLGGWAASYMPIDGTDWIRVPGWHETAEQAKLAAFDVLCPA